MKISNIKNKYLRRIVYWLAMPVVYVIMVSLLILGMACAGIAGAIVAIRWEYTRRWKASLRGPWESRKRM